MVSDLVKHSCPVLVSVYKKQNGQKASHIYDICAEYMYQYMYIVFDTCAYTNMVKARSHPVFVLSHHKWYRNYIVKMGSEPILAM